MRGISAPQAQAEQRELEALKDELSHLVGMAGEVANSLSTTVSRVFGPDTPGDGTENVKAVQSGSIAELRSLCRDLRERLNWASDYAGRLTQL